MEAHQDRLIPLKDAAKQIGIPIETLRGARKRKTLVLPIVKTAPRILAVRQSDIDEVVAGRREAIVTRKAAAMRLVEGV